MNNRKLVTTPVQEGPVKAKPGPIETPEQGSGPKVVDVPPPAPQTPGDGDAPIDAEPGL